MAFDLDSGFAFGSGFGSEPAAMCSGRQWEQEHPEVPSRRMKRRTNWMWEWKKCREDDRKLAKMSSTEPGSHRKTRWRFFLERFLSKRLSAFLQWALNASDDTPDDAVAQCRIAPIAKEVTVSSLARNLSRLRLTNYQSRPPGRRRRKTTTPIGSLP